MGLALISDEKRKARAVKAQDAPGNERVFDPAGKATNEYEVFVFEDRTCFLLHRPGRVCARRLRARGILHGERAQTVPLLQHRQNKRKNSVRERDRPEKERLSSVTHGYRKKDIHESAINDKH